MSYLVLESGEVFEGQWHGIKGGDSAGEVVFNTSHSGYEEIATDPSYYSQIVVMTAPMQGNYGVIKEFWESEKIWIKGFVCLELQDTKRESGWKDLLQKSGVPAMDEVDTRRLVKTLRSKGTVWGAMVSAETQEEAIARAKLLIIKEQQKDKDWCYATTTKDVQILKGKKTSGPRVAVIDLGCKKNIVRELLDTSSEVGVFPSRVSAQEIMNFKPDGVMLSNGPGDPKDVQKTVETVKSLLGKVYIMGICMGHHILALALGGQTYKLKFGHRGSNHPIRDELLKKVYVSSQNHGYAVDQKSLPEGIDVTHWNINDNTVAGLKSAAQKCFSVQYHPESHPGPHEARELFTYFMSELN